MSDLSSKAFLELGKELKLLVFLILDHTSVRIIGEDRGPLEERLIRVRNHFERNLPFCSCVRQSRRRGE